MLVTGASAGIGHAAAVRFAAAGAQVLVHGRDVSRTTDVAREVGGRALIADLASPADRQRLADEAVNAFGRVDVLVNNAGFGHSGPFTAMSVDAVRRLIEVDLVAAIELTHALLPGMVAQKRGAVSFVTSIAGRTGVAGEAVYSATKAGLDAFAESLRAETVGSGVNISVVIPGVVDTGFFETRGRPYERTTPRPIPADVVADAVVGDGGPRPRRGVGAAVAADRSHRARIGARRVSAACGPLRRAGAFRLGHTTSLRRRHRYRSATQRNPM